MFDRKIKIGFFLCLLLGLFLRYQYFSDVFTNQGYIAANTDAYYRLHRIETIVNQPGLNFFYPLFDQKLDFPNGLQVAWPLGLDIMFAAPLKILGVHDPISISFLCFLLIPLLLIPFLIIFGRVAQQNTTPRGTVLGMFLFVTLPVMVMVSIVGNLDHHALGSFFILLAFYLLEKKSFTFLSLLLGLSSAFDPHAWFMCLPICAYACVQQDAAFIQKICKSTLIAFGLSLFVLAFSNRFATGYISLSGFSWWASAMFLVTSLFLKVLTFLLEKKIPRKNVFVGALITVAVMIAIVKITMPIFWKEFYSGWEWLALKRGTIGQTTESASIFRLPLMQWREYWLFFFMPIVAIYFLFKKKHLSILAYAVFPLIFTFFQTRFMVMSAPWIILLFVIWIEEVIQNLPNEQSRLRAIIVVTGVLVGYFYSNTQHLKFKTTDLVHSYFAPVRDGSKFLRKYTDATAAIVKNPSAVTAAWDFGHWIVFFSGLPVVASPFQGFHSGMVNTLFASEDLKEFDTFQDKIPARFLMVEHSVPRTYELLSYVGKDPKKYFDVKDEDGIKKISMLPDYENVFANRFFSYLGMDHAQVPEHWRLIYVSGYPAADVPTIPALKILEHVEGVKVVYSSTRDDLYLQGAVADRQNLYVVKKKGRNSPEKTVVWTFPYGEFNDGGVFCDGNFVIVDSRNKIIQKLPKITNEQVLLGQTIYLK